MSLQHLNDDILSRIAEHLPLHDVSALTQVSPSLRVSDAVWRSAIEKQFHTRVADWPTLSSPRCLGLFLSRHSRLLGTWTADTPPRGQLLSVRIHAGSLLAQRIALVPTQRLSAVTEIDLHKCPLFRLVPHERVVDNVRSVFATCEWFPRPHAGVRRVGWEEFLHIPDDAPPGPSWSTEAVAFLPGGRHFVLRRPVATMGVRLGQGFGAEMFLGTGDLSQSQEEVRLRFETFVMNNLVPLEKWPMYTMYTRIDCKLTAHGRPESDEDLADDCPTGLFWGDFGPHGPEAVYVSRQRGHLRSQDRYVGIKCTGDPNVPTSVTTFVVSATPERFELSNAVLVLLNPNKHIASVHRGRGRIAREGFTNPQWTSALMLRYTDGEFGVLFAVDYIMHFRPLVL